MVGNVQRLLQQINTVLSHSQFDLGMFNQNYPSHDMVLLLKRLVQTLAFHQGALGVRLDFESTEDSLICLGLESKIEEIVFGILIEALRLTRPGDTLTVQLSRFEEWGVSFARIVVKDNGKGMEPEELENLFDVDTELSHLPLLDRSHHFPLTLALIEKMVILQEGSISIDSKKDVGTVYSIELPIKAILSAGPAGV
jgi:signal transduction histidine kinase